MNSENDIDIVAFYSFDYLGRDKKRIAFVLPRIKKYVKEVIFIENITSYYSHGLIREFVENDITGYGLTNVVKKVE